MFRFAPMVASLAAGFLFLLAPASFAQTAADHLLFTEFAYTPTDGEFFEIYNPTPNVIDLSNYYVSDYVLAATLGSPERIFQNYWHIVDGALVPSGGFATDFCARFPAGTVITPGESIVISLNSAAAFEGIWDEAPDFKISPAIDGVPSMVDPGPETVGVPLIQASAGLSNGSEAIVLFFWDGVSDLVQDVDIVQWDADDNIGGTIAPNKTGILIEGPDADAVATPYLADTLPGAQSVVDVRAQLFLRTVTRSDHTEGLEVTTGGNGQTGNDETSENYSATWLTNTEPSIGFPGAFGPPVLLGGAAQAVDQMDLFFSRDLDRASAERQSNFSILAVLTPGGAVTQVPTATFGATLLDDNRTIRLETDDLAALTLYRIVVNGVRSEDLRDEVVQGTQVLVYGYNAASQLVLDVPPRPFVPHLDGIMEIRYIAPQGEEILLRVFDNRGRELFILAEEPAPAGGQRTLRWNGRDHLRQKLPAGMYYLHLSSSVSAETAVAPVVIGVASEEAIR